MLDFNSTQTFIIYINSNTILSRPQTRRSPAFSVQLLAAGKGLSFSVPVILSPPTSRVSRILNTLFPGTISTFEHSVLHKPVPISYAMESTTPDAFAVNTERFLEWLQKRGIVMSPKMALVDLRAEGRGRGVGKSFHLCLFHKSKPIYCPRTCWSCFHEKTTL